jgi:hypothetical protein
LWTLRRTISGSSSGFPAGVRTCGGFVGLFGNSFRRLRGSVHSRTGRARRRRRRRRDRCSRTRRALSLHDLDAIKLLPLLPFL